MKYKYHLLNKDKSRHSIESENEPNVELELHKENLLAFFIWAETNGRPSSWVKYWSANSDLPKITDEIVKAKEAAIAPTLILKEVKSQPEIPRKKGSKDPEDPELISKENEYFVKAFEYCRNYNFSYNGRGYVKGNSMYYVKSYNEWAKDPTKGYLTLTSL